MAELHSNNISYIKHRFITKLDELKSKYQNHHKRFQLNIGKFRMELNVKQENENGIDWKQKYLELNKKYQHNLDELIKSYKHRIMDLIDDDMEIFKSEMIEEFQKNEANEIIDLCHHSNMNINKRKRSRNDLSENNANDEVIITAPSKKQRISDISHNDADSNYTDNDDAMSVHSLATTVAFTDRNEETKDNQKPFSLTTDNAPIANIQEDDERTVSPTPPPSTDDNNVATTQTQQRLISNTADSRQKNSQPNVGSQINSTSTAMQHRQQSGTGYIDNSTSAQILALQQQVINHGNNGNQRGSIQQQMAAFIAQLQQFPPLFRHLQNNPQVMARLLQAFKRRQEQLQRQELPKEVVDLT